MVKIKEFTDAGLRCPSCNSGELRSGYHEFQTWGSWICKHCGFRWMEDLPLKDYSEALIGRLNQDMLRDWQDRLIWVLHVAKEPEKPLKNPKSSDETTYDQFIRGGE